MRASQAALSLQVACAFELELRGLQHGLQEGALEDRTLNTLADKHPPGAFTSLQLCPLSLPTRAALQRRSLLTINAYLDTGRWLTCLAVDSSAARLSLFARSAMTPL